MKIANTPRKKWERDVREALVCLTGIVFLLSWSGSITASQPDEARLREKMVREQIIERGVRNQRVLQAMRDVPRHLFVPPAARREAYSDKPLPIGQDQTISQPYIVALMTELLRPESDDVVLEVGTGSGYQAAVLSQLVARVYTIEILPALAEGAEHRLQELGYENVTVKAGDGYLGWPEQAPFDGIVVTAAPPEIPGELLSQLKRGGRMVVPVGESSESQNLLLLEKSKTSDQIVSRTVIPVRFVPMVRQPAP
ncbi:MAG: protein-L-isoaspartate(D-aspartate) O-methyltransferase [Acidobacteria bacterium]|nr:protein-L-isoaspartate(D-aspartate) O-methyltransferase [Acidobacteriota bacterium]